MNIWQLQEAKRKFSKVVESALDQGPQIIVRRGEKTVVVISYKDYLQLRKPQPKLSEFFRASPLAEVDLDFEHDRSLLRQAAKRLGM